MILNESGSLIYRYDNETVKIEAWGDNAVRIRATKNKEFTGRDWALDSKDAKTADVAFEIVTTNREECFGDTNPVKIGTLTNGKIVVEINEFGAITVRNSAGKTLLREYGRRNCDPGSMVLNIPPRVFKGAQTGLFKTTVRFVSDPVEKLFGMGQYQQQNLNLKGCVLELAQRNSQVSVPFCVSDAGYGFLWNNPAIGQVAFGVNYTEWTAEQTPEIDYLVIAGDTPAEIIGEYMHFTGLPPMMPEYGLGFWQCKLRYGSQVELLNVARKYKELGIPLDVIVCDFFHWPNEGDYCFEPSLWPNPAEMCKELDEMGIRLMVSVWPTISQRSENYNEMLEKGYLTQSERGVRTMMNMGNYVTFFDATNPDARDYVWEKIKKNYWDQGAKLYWLDVAEPEYQTYDYDLYRYQMGGDLEVGNVYPKLYLKMFYDGMSENGDDNPVSLIRSAWAGSAKYGGLVWSGDIESSFECFKRQVSAGLNMAVAGIPWWTTDISGFHGGNGEYPLFRELFARWFAYACFCPVMRLHGNRQNGHPIPGSHISSGGDNEIWSFGDVIYGICKKYITLREELRPYIRQQMLMAHENGTPVMRPMFYDFPKDKKCWEIDTQYMFGPDYLVSPVTDAGVTEKIVYLPAGKWKNIDTGEVYEGGCEVTAPAPIDVIPVFKRI